MSTNAPAPVQPADYPGKTLGLVGLILAIVMPLVGLIISIVAANQSKKAGFANGLAKAGIIVGVILLALGVVIGIIMVILTAVAANNMSTTY